jgi:hypothetical protein
MPAFEKFLECPKVADSVEKLVYILTCHGPEI